MRYADLRRALEHRYGPGQACTPAEVAEVVRDVRRSKGMMVVEGEADCRSAGSFFKNPALDRAAVERIGAAVSQAPPHFAAPDAGLFKVPAAWLIEQAGFTRGFALGRAAISSRHTLALTNRGNATAEEVLALAARIVKTVEARFGVRLVMEPVRVGFSENQSDFVLTADFRAPSFPLFSAERVGGQ